MVRNRLLRAVVGVWVGICAFAAVAQPMPEGVPDEMQEHMQIQREVGELMKRDNFAALDALAARYREGAERTSSGIWKLDVFYKAVFEEHFYVEEPPPSRWVARQAWAERWVEAFPQSPTAHMVVARELHYRGLKFRGTGYYSEIPAKNLEGFRRYRDKAAAYLEAHKAVASKDPYYYSTLENVANVSNWSDERFRAIFDEGTARHPDFPAIYYVAMTHATPQWGGSADATRELLKHALTRVPAKQRASLYALMVTEAMKDWRGTLFDKGVVDWKLMRRGMDDVMKQYPTPWNIQTFALMSCYAKDRVATRALLKRGGEQPIWGLWHPDKLEECREFAAGTP